MDREIRVEVVAHDRARVVDPPASEPETAPGTDRKAETPPERRKPVVLKSASSEVPTAWPALLMPSARENPTGPGGSMVVNW